MSKTCPKCGGDLIVDVMDGYRFATFVGKQSGKVTHKAIFDTYGYCEQCGTPYNWEEVYNFSKIQNLKEERE